MKTPLWWKRLRIRCALRRHDALTVWFEIGEVWRLTRDTTIPYYDSGVNVHIRLDGYRLNITGDYTLRHDNPTGTIKV